MALEVTNNFINLPDELNVAICCFLNGTDLGIVTLVSKKFNELANDPQIWRNFAANEFQIKLDSDEDPKKSVINYQINYNKNLIDRLKLQLINRDNLHYMGLEGVKKFKSIVEEIDKPFKQYLMLTDLFKYLYTNNIKIKGFMNGMYDGEIIWGANRGVVKLIIDAGLCKVTASNIRTAICLSGHNNSEVAKYLILKMEKSDRKECTLLVEKCLKELSEFITKHSISEGTPLFNKYTSIQKFIKEKA